MEQRRTEILSQQAGSLLTDEQRGGVRVGAEVVLKHG